MQQLAQAVAERVVVGGCVGGAKAGGHSTKQVVAARHCGVDAAPAWCLAPVPSIYGHVQRTYWNNGFLRYWELKQTPNFLLAAPALFVAFSLAFFYSRFIWLRCERRVIPVLKFLLGKELPGVFSPQMLPHVLHLAALAAFALLNMHVEVATRLLCAASPAFHTGWKE